MFRVVNPLSRMRSGLTETLVIFLSCFLLTGCIVTADQSVEGNPKDPRAQDIVDQVRSIDLLPRQTADVGSGGSRAVDVVAARGLSQRRHDTAGFDGDGARRHRFGQRL